MQVAPGGDILTVNGGNGKIVETTPFGRQAGTEFLDTSGSPAGAGAPRAAVRPAAARSCGSTAVPQPTGVPGPGSSTLAQALGKLAQAALVAWPT
jgi:hypothetical protein